MSGWTPRRDDGWAPIGEYGVLGDGRTVALVAGDGRIDWWPLPTLDAPPVFAAVLDPPNGGRIELCPVGPYTVSRRYAGDSNVLQTTFHTQDGAVRVTDALTVGPQGPLPWAELVRRVEGVDGEVKLRWAVVPGNRFASASPWVETQRGAVLVHCGDQHLALRPFDIGDPVVTHQAVSGSFRTAPGSQHLFSLSATDDAPVFFTQQPDLERRLDATIDYWQSWSTRLAYEGPWREAVVRSALALKTLGSTRTGAIAAAGTTSLPERIGGDKNWDYRYVWIRDASYTVDAFLALEVHEQVDAAVTWLLRAVRSTTPGLQVFYALDGSVPHNQDDLDVPGYRNSQPVRSGNGASGQLQLGTFGDLFDSVWQYVDAGHLLDPPTGRLLAQLADRCCDVWRRPDSGIWELHTSRQYTVSKMGCWVALDRAVKLHDQGQIASGHAERWAAERDAVHAWVDEHCWSEEKSAYTFYAGSEELDAAMLLAGLNGFDRGERLAGTLAAVRRELGRGPLVYRYSGMAQEEGAFLACSFWVVTALAALWRREEAEQAMAEAVALGNDLGLFAEQQDPASGEMLGNVPQGLSHLALINAACALRRLADAQG